MRPRMASRVWTSAALAVAAAFVSFDAAWSAGFTPSASNPPTTGFLIEAGTPGATHFASGSSVEIRGSIRQVGQAGAGGGNLLARLGKDGARVRAFFPSSSREVTHQLTLSDGGPHAVSFSFVTPPLKQAEPSSFSIVLTSDRNGTLASRYLSLLVDNDDTAASMGSSLQGRLLFSVSFDPGSAIEGQRAGAEARVSNMQPDQGRNLWTARFLWQGAQVHATSPLPIPGGHAVAFSFHFWSV